jgi:hypothetical protein
MKMRRAGWLACSIATSVAWSKATLSGAMDAHTLGIASL